VFFQTRPSNHLEFAINVAMNAAPLDVDSTLTEVRHDYGNGSIKAGEGVTVIDPRVAHFVSRVRMRLAD